MLFHKTVKAVQPDWQSGLFSNKATQNPVTVEAESQLLIIALYHTVTFTTAVRTP